jgi:hypothetical protein
MDEIMNETNNRDYYDTEIVTESDNTEKSNNTDNTEVDNKNDD